MTSSSTPPRVGAAYAVKIDPYPGVSSHTPDASPFGRSPLPASRGGEGGGQGYGVEAVGDAEAVAVGPAPEPIPVTGASDDDEHDAGSSVHADGAGSTCGSTRPPQPMADEDATTATHPKIQGPPECRFAMHAS